MFRRCKFWKICNGYSPESFTCNKSGGGDYCGKWRYFRNLPKSERKKMLEGEIIG